MGQKRIASDDFYAAIGDMLRGTNLDDYRTSGIFIVVFRAADAVISFGARDSPSITKTPETAETGSKDGVLHDVSPPIRALGA